MVLDALLGTKTKQAQRPAEDDDFWYQPSTSFRSASGENVSPERAMSLSAYYACLRNISEDCAKFPFKLFKDKPGGGREYMAKHPVNNLLMWEPNDNATPMAVWEVIFHWAMAWGTGCAIIERNGSQRPRQLLPVHPSRVTLEHDRKDNIVWRVNNAELGPSYVPDEDMFHLHGLGNGLTGYSVAQLGAESLGRALAVQRYGSALFGSGGSDRIALVHPGKLGKEEAAANIRRSWKELYGGSANHGPAVLQEGMKVERVGIPPEDAQMLETMRFTVEDVARWFRCPTSKIQHWLQAKGWSTLDAENKDYVFDTLTPWLLRAEQEANRKLLSLSEKDYYTKHVINFLMWADPQARAAYLQTRLKSGTLTANEWRELEDEDPIGPEGDVYWIEGNNLQPVSKAIAGPPEPEPSPEPEPEPPDDDELEDAEPEEPPPAGSEADAQAARLTAFVPLIEDAADRIVSSEVQKLSTRLDKVGNRPKWNAWVASFYDGHRAYISRTIAPIMRAWHQSTSVAPDSEQIVETVGSHACRLIVSAEDPAATVEQWKTDGPAWVAGVITQGLRHD